ncbi:hypothetical protein EYC84_003745 [Monilinia fructicola]|uniref:Uncharacterized protein n=1 Tax=Monilinia fructicola TaxID=38448 RepID=A0A5M9JZX1_MONFR|nr:hypothetical protein EYC84_003745 [Monilinia fructicola]
MDPETSRNHVETVSTLLASLLPPSATPLSNHSPISLLEINKLIAKDDRMPSLVSGFIYGVAHANCLTYKCLRVI